ncbi:NHLP-related RiPP peptide [Stenotrophomonas sp.]|uniref:NHLP-related RiPP peptide n=1 Tax=Stenotrophomonas sp. TaxID=69392 RepID=UPI002898E6AF|nr:NHLP-related RiPP peptide [Stenotrophomonas sp.]
MTHKRPLTALHAGRLLDLLCGDDAFRASFAADPTAALAEYGLQSMTVPGACALPGELASKEEFATVRDQLQTSVTRNALFMNPHFFQAGSVQDQIQASAISNAA